jgi:membrane peptidoglycan carboxypeptidase
MKSLSAAARRLLLTVLIGGTAVGACMAALLPGAAVLATSHHYTSDRLGKLRDLAQRSAIYDAANNQIALLGIQNRQEVPLSEVPQVLINAVIATEDKTYWANDGVDLNAVFRAFVKNVTSGQIEQGGSTITQQLVKNRILTSKRDINRKIREIVLAFRLNEKYTKKEILEQYLNTVYFGQGSYGVKSAAERFFLVANPETGYVRGKGLNELTLGEAALLAGEISNPEGNNPYTYPDRALKRRHFVLSQMVAEHYAT